MVDTESEASEAPIAPSGRKGKAKWVVVSVLIAGLGAVALTKSPAPPATESSSAPSEPRLVVAEKPATVARFVRPQIPRTADPIVSASARKAMLDEKQQLKAFDDEWDQIELTLIFARLIEAGHGPGVLTLARDMCSPDQPIRTQQDYHACKVASYVNTALVNERHPIATADEIYRSIAMAAFLQKDGKLANGEAFLAGVAQNIERARSRGANQREMAALDEQVQALQADISKGRADAANAVIGLIALLAASDNSTPETRAGYDQYWERRAEEAKQRDRDECMALAIGGYERDYATAGCYPGM